MFIRTVMVSTLVLLASIGLVLAEPGSSEDDKALAEALRAWTTAFNRHDAAALAQVYTDDADLVYTLGERITGRAAIEKDFANYFAKNPNVQSENKVISRRYLKPDVCIEDGDWKEWDHTEKGLATSGRYTAVMIKQEGRWFITCDRAYIIESKPDGTQ